MGLSWAESYLGRQRAFAGDDERLLFVASRGVIIDDQNRLLLIQRSDNHRWAIPAGAMELGESMEECAIRETWEETGLTATSLTPFAFYSRAQFVNDYGHAYQQILMAFRIHTWEGELLKATDETIDAGFFPLDALPGERSFIIEETLADLATFESTGRLVLK
ncbi:NUDIX domain-containing protein [Actinoplanes sp. NPDC051470]|uniref:NUDIX domain-containing protein n=1 Tax=unclassified Actinoplanes TaxID=2626549 RepID=UPI0034256733